MPVDPAFGGMIEKDWDAWLFGTKGAATQVGWTSYHTLRSKGSAPGFPDRTCWRERLLFVELKTEKNKPSDRQIEFMTGMVKAGAEVYLWKPSDVEEAIRVLGMHADFQAPWLTPKSKIGPSWCPASLWTSHGCRADGLA